MDPVDKNGMLQVIEQAPAQIAEAAKISIPAPDAKAVRGIVFSGMGGSAISADIISNVYLSEIKKLVYVNRDYTIPDSFGPGNLFIAISYSGNTEETLSALKDAEARKMHVLCISSGGKLKEIASSKKHHFIEIPAGYQPRAAFYIITTTIIKALEAYGIIKSQKENLAEAEQVIEGLKSRASEARLLAQKIKDKVPVIFASSGVTEACGLRLKNQFNENSKVPAFLSVFPELNHNELAGFSLFKKGANPFAMIVLRDEEEHIRIVKRIEITKSLIGANFGGANEIRSRGKSRLARLLSLVFYGDMLSVYHAISRGVDPTPVDIIERLKKELKR